jgi:hypothetical protein
MKRTYRAILIDPETRSITEIQTDGDYKNTLKLIGCKIFTTGSRPLNGSLENGFDTVNVSDDLLEEREDPRFWFQVDADRNSPSSFPIAGRDVVEGIDEAGGTCDARISIEALEKRITGRSDPAARCDQGRGQDTCRPLAAHRARCCSNSPDPPSEPHWLSPWPGDPPRGPGANHDGPWHPDF